MKKLTIHTDGGCQGNPGPGGWAAILKYGEHVKEVSGALPMTTNNRMELQAAIGALSVVKEPCEIELFTDSAYLRNGISEWLPAWKARGWRTVEKKVVKNEDLWRQLDQLAARHKISWRWLKGHAGHIENERCDELAGEAMAKIRKEFTAEQLAALKTEFEVVRAASHQKELL